MVYSAEGVRILTTIDHQIDKGFSKREGLLKGVPPNFEYTGYVLAVPFAGQDFPLPIVTVNPTEAREKHISIAYVYPLKPDLAGAMVQDMTSLIFGLIKNDGWTNPLLLMGPPTNKSKLISSLTKINLQARTERQVDLKMFSGGEFQLASDARQVVLPLISERESTTVFPDRKTGVFQATGHRDQRIVGVCYQPVTGKNKFLYLDEFEINNLSTFINKGGRIILVEDVVTTGTTIGAMRRLLTNFCNVPAQALWTVAAAFEGNQPCPWPQVKHVIRLPEWVGQF